KKVFTNKIVKNLIAAFSVGIIIIVLVSFFLKAYTHHGEKIFTPSFKGLTVEEAENLAIGKNIKILVIDSVFDAYGKPGTVLEQTPNTNFMIKGGRTIFLTIKAIEEKIVLMPNLSSISLIQARSLIESAGLKMGRVKYIPSNFDDMVIEQRVLDKLIAPGAEITAGTEINLVVGQSSGTEAVVPSLVDLTLDDAKFKAAEYSLNIGNVFYDASVISSRDSALSVVYKQSFTEGSIVGYGADIDVWLTRK
ncbi:MAG: PASTA domain-containing protein, partial [Bacteroidota bacterium]|nr:PASTA domain-containing protein [Bacteroidota bacterium]